MNSGPGQGSQRATARSRHRHRGTPRSYVSLWRTLFKRRASADWAGNTVSGFRDEVLEAPTAAYREGVTVTLGARPLS